MIRPFGYTLILFNYKCSQTYNFEYIFKYSNNKCIQPNLVTASSLSAKSCKTREWNWARNQEFLQDNLIILNDAVS